MAKQSNPLQKLILRAAEQIVLTGAALRHAEAALATGRVAEAYVVLEAEAQGHHLTLRDLAERTSAKEIELLDAANLADEKTLLEAYLAHVASISENTPVRSR